MFFFFKQKTAYVMRISDWSSDVCSSDLLGGSADRAVRRRVHPGVAALNHELLTRRELRNDACLAVGGIQGDDFALDPLQSRREIGAKRSEEHTSELQSLMRISYAVFCLKKKKNLKNVNAHKSTTLKNDHLIRHLVLRNKKTHTNVMT